jgi:cobalt/nickel transport system permease protein
MHMADALISPAVGGSLWVAGAGLLSLCARRVRQSLREDLVPLMGVLGAFVFAAQMVNFSIPGTGSSGHLGGGLLLAVLLGPPAAFLVIASVLTVQALFFADGGLLALGCNIINLGFFPAFVAYPLCYRPLARGEYGTLRAGAAAVVAGVIGLQLGAVGVVAETAASGLSALPVGRFALLMLPIHLAIGVVEGLATAVVVAFVARARPEALLAAAPPDAPARLRPVLVGLLAAAAVLGGLVSWYASAHPDGLEWAAERAAGTAGAASAESGAHRALAAVQDRTALLPDYGFTSAATGPAVRAGTSVSGLVGGLLTLLLAGAAGWVIRGRGTRPHAARS